MTDFASYLRYTQQINKTINNEKKINSKLNIINIETQEKLTFIKHLKTTSKNFMLESADMGYKGCFIFSYSLCERFWVDSNKKIHRFKTCTNSDNNINCFCSFESNQDSIQKPPNIKSYSIKELVYSDFFKDEMDKFMSELSGSSKMITWNLIEPEDELLDINYQILVTW